MAEDKKRSLAFDVEAAMPNGRGSRIASATPELVTGLATLRVYDKIDEWLDSVIREDVEPKLKPAIRRATQSMHDDGSLPKVARKILDEIMAATMAAQADEIKAQLEPIAKEAVKKYIAQNWEKVIELTCEKAMKDALAEVRANLDRKLGGGK